MSPVRRLLCLLAVVLLGAEAGAVAEEPPPCPLSQADADLLQSTLDTWRHVSTDLLALPEEPLPWMILVGEECEWDVAADTAVRRDLRATERTMSFGDSRYPIAVREHGATVELPSGTRIPAAPTAFSSSYRAAPDAPAVPFFVMAMPALWRAAVPEFAADQHELEEFFRLVISHEMTHTRQPLAALEAAVEALQARFDLPEDLDDDVIEKRFAAVDGFEPSWRRERDLLYRAAFAEDEAEKRQLAARALRMAGERRARFFRGAAAPYAELEELFLGMEGPAVWSSFRLYQSDPAHSDDPRDVVEELQGDRHQAWSQDEGLALMLLIDALVPGWREQAFGSEPLRPFELLGRALGLEAERRREDSTAGALGAPAAGRPRPGRLL